MPIKQLEDLVEGQVTEADYYSPKGQLLIAKGEVITAQHLSLLRRRNIFEIHIHYDEIKQPGDTKSLLVPEQKTSLSESKAGTVNIQLSEKLLLEKWNIKPGREGYEQLLADRSLESLDRALKLERVCDHPTGRALRFNMRQQYLFQRPFDYKNNVLKAYTNTLETVKIILNRLVNCMPVDCGTIRNIAERFVKLILTDRNILLSIATQKVDRHDPVYNHTLNVCLLSMNIAASCDFSEEQVILIGMGALLHDVGMLLVPRSIRFKEGRLNEEEWYEVRKHPLFGLHIIEKMLRVPDAVKYVAYQTHERENGKGYPKQRAGRLIHNFAKITQIADIFDAVSSPRPYRSAYTPFRGVEMLIKMAGQKLISETYVNAFLKSASFFPVGSMVELSDGRIAQVIAANEYHPARPLCSVIAERSGMLLDPSDTYILDLALDTTIQVVKSLPFNATICDALYGF